MKNIAVIGSGPIGIDAAAAFLEQGHKASLYERGENIAQSVREWGSHVQLFSNNSLNISTRMSKLLGDSAPQSEIFPSGAEYVESVLEPAVKRMRTCYGERFQTFVNSTVVAIGKGGLRKTEAVCAVGDKRRSSAKFRLLVTERASGEEDTCKTEKYVSDFDVVVDCTGTYGAANANNIGVGGLPAIGEHTFSDARLMRTIPDVKGCHRNLFSGKRVALIGSGYSAATVLSALSDLGREDNGKDAPKSVLWLTRKENGAAPYGRIANDPLPQRDLLCAKANALSANEEPAAAQSIGLQHVAEAGVLSMLPTKDHAVEIQYEVGGSALEQAIADVVVALVGYRPQTDLYREIHVHQCYASEGPMKLAATLLAASAGGGGGDCLSQAAPGPATLENPEPDFFILGSKSYGRNSAFLLRIGFEQVDLLTDRIGPANVEQAAAL